MQSTAAAAARLSREYRDSLISGDGRRAERVISDLLTLGMDPAEIYLSVFTPALHSVGALWEQGIISVAEEHLATAITERLMSDLQPMLQKAAREEEEEPTEERRPRPVLLLACVASEMHRVGARMVSDLFVRGGWDVLFLGASVPAVDLVALVRDRKPDLVALSVTMDHYVSEAEAVVRLLRANPDTRAIPVLVGGAAFAGNPEWREAVGADLIARTADEALALANSLIAERVEQQEASPEADEEAALAEFRRTAWEGEVEKAMARIPALRRPQERRGDDASSAVAFLLDANSRIRWTNAAGAALAGVADPAVLATRGFVNLVDRRSREKLGRLMDRVSSGETLVDFEINHLVPVTSTLVLIAYTALRIPFAEGEDGTAILLIGRDLTHRLDAVARLAAANQELERIVAAMAQDRQRLEAQALRFADAKQRMERLWENERRIALALQSSFLGDVPNSLPGLEVAYRYHAAMEDTQVGGDFYDVSPVDEDQVAIVVADVSGKGLRAALATVMVKYTLRAYAAEDPSPATVLRRFNRFVHAHGDLEGFITVFYGLLNVRSGELRWGSAGHEPALLVRADSGEVEVLSNPELVVGAIEDAAYTEMQAVLHPGDLLLAYTDGIVEARAARDSRLFFEQERVIALAADCQRGVGTAADAVAAVIYDAVSEHAGGLLNDDATLLAVRRV